MSGRPTPLFGALVICAAACVSRRAPGARDVSERLGSHCPAPGAPAWTTPPAWLANLISRGLYVRDAGAPVEAPAEDVAVLRTYLRGADLGPLMGGARLTLLAQRRPYAVDEAVRVVHVLEHTLPGQSLYVMGPKEVTGEFVDGALASPAEPAAGGLSPTMYDGVVLPSPGGDTNFERTIHRFHTPGLHSVQWRAGGLVSNELCIEVR